MPSVRSEEPASVSVAALRDGDEVDGIFACTHKERRVARTGSPYLDVELRDSTGSIRARAFREADVLGGRFERGELVRVRGRVGRYRDELQLELDAIARAGGEAEPERFLPLAYRDLDELEGFLEHLSREIYDPPLRALVETVLADSDLRYELRRAPCSIPVAAGRGPAPGSVHHAYLGGLLEHTVAVATLALEACTLHPRLDRDLLLAAAVVHDLGKTREFTYGAEIARSDEGLMLGHVEIGLRLIRERAPRSLPEPRMLALEHCLLLHHGSEAAAGRRFRTAEAVALYRLNLLDSHVKAALETGAL